MSAIHWRITSAALGLVLAIAAIATDSRWVTWLAIAALATALALRVYARRRQE